MHKITVTDARSLPGDSAFLLDDGKTSILYDSGFAFTGAAVAEKIKTALGNRSLDFIFLTHSHYDHALGSVYAKRAFPQAQVVAGAYAQKIFQKSTARAVMRDLDKKFAKTCGVMDYEDLIDDLQVDISVNDGDIINCGNMTFTVVGLPGHTRCSVGFYLAENKMLLGSETLGVYGGDGIVVPSCLVGYQMTLDSIAKTEAMDIETVLVPHYGLLGIEETKAYLHQGKVSIVSTAQHIADILKKGGTAEDAAAFFRDIFYHGYIKTIYPVDAMELNTGIMVELIRRELCEME